MTREAFSYRQTLEACELMGTPTSRASLELELGTPVTEGRSPGAIRKPFMSSCEGGISTLCTSSSTSFGSSSRGEANKMALFAWNVAGFKP